MLAIQNSDITVYQSRDKFTVAMQKGNVSQTFALNTATVKTTVANATTGNTDEMPISLLDLATKEISSAENNETISKDLTSFMGEEKKIPTIDQTNLIR